MYFGQTKRIVNILAEMLWQMSTKKTGTEYSLENAILIVNVGGRSIMICGCVSALDVGNIKIMKGRMNRAYYRNILEKNSRQSAHLLSLKPGWFFQLDNDPKLIANLTKSWLISNRMDVLRRPWLFPDHMIGNLWSGLKLRNLNPYSAKPA